MKLKWKKNWKRPAVVLAVMVLVGASVYLNWKYAGNVAETDKILGQATLVNENGEGVTVTEDAAAASENDYFATARLSRKQARDSAISMLQEAEMDENATEEVCNEASQTLQVLAGYTVAESQIENLVTAKGYADCVVFMGTDSCSVVVDAGENGLEATDVAKIKDIVMHSRPCWCRCAPTALPIRRAKRFRSKRSCAMIPRNPARIRLPLSFTTNKTS